MGFLDKFLDTFKLNDYDEYDDYDDFDDADDYEEEKSRKRFFKKLEEEDEGESFSSAAPNKKAEKSSVKTAKQAKTTSSKVTPIRNAKKSGNTMGVCVLKPTNMEDTREIADTLIGGSTVVLNLEGLDVELAQRIIDFTSGACYSIGGSLQKISSYIFILTPANVDITGDFQEILNGAFDIPAIRTEF